MIVEKVRNPLNSRMLFTWILLVITLVVLGVVHVAQKSRNHSLSQNARQIETEISELHTLIGQLKSQQDAMLDRQRLENRREVSTKPMQLIHNNDRVIFMTR